MTAQLQCSHPMGLDNPVWAPAGLAEDVSAQVAVAAVEEKCWEAEKQVLAWVVQGIGCRSFGQLQP